MRPVLVGLSPREATLTVADYFARFPWEGLPFDPGELSAADFLEVLG